MMVTLALRNSKDIQLRVIWVLQHCMVRCNIPRILKYSFFVGYTWLKQTQLMDNNHHGYHGILTVVILFIFFMTMVQLSTPFTVCVEMENIRHSVFMRTKCRERESARGREREIPKICHVGFLVLRLVFFPKTHMPRVMYPILLVVCWKSLGCTTIPSGYCSAT